MLKIKRVYEKPDIDDGLRILIDRLWPRGLSKDKARIDEWMKEVAPSNILRKWFGHKEQHWREFQLRYIEELNDKNELIKKLKNLAKKQTITLLYGARDTERNNAIVLADYLKK